MEAAVLIFMIIYLLILLGILMLMQGALYAYMVVAYILEGKTLSAIARRRGIEKPWLAWVPVGNWWMLGAISDQYRYLVHGQVRNRRKLLLCLGAVFGAATVLLLTVVEVWGLCTVFSAIGQNEETILSVCIGGVALIYLLVFAYVGVAAVISVFQYMAYYDLFRSCDPGKSLVYLLVGIFAGYPMPFFLYSCRDKDLGMPPRRDADL